MAQLFDEALSVLSMGYLPEAGGINDQDPDMWQALMIVSKARDRARASQPK